MKVKLILKYSFFKKLSSGVWAGFLRGVFLIFVKYRGMAACGRAKLLEESAYGALANPERGLQRSPPAGSFQK